MMLMLSMVTAFRVRSEKHVEHQSPGIRERIVTTVEIEKEDEVRKLILRMAIALDGVVAPDKAKEVFDFSDEGVWSDTFAMLETVDTMLLGAGMHQEYLSYWQTALTSPTASQNERRFATRAARTPHFVLSRTLREVEWPNATVLSGGVDGIAALKNQAGRDIILWGGPTAAAAAIEAGVVDEYHLVTHPVIAVRTSIIG
jgi:dihydrofolate reductase